MRGRSLSDREVLLLLAKYGQKNPGEGEPVIKLLMKLNRSYESAPPTKRRVISDRIERDSLVVKLLKRLHGLNCQLCGGEFFKKKGGVGRYCEVHHMLELSRGGSQATDNCLVLCANCHRKMHYGAVTVEGGPDSISIIEDGERCVVRKNKLSQLSSAASGESSRAGQRDN